MRHLVFVFILSCALGAISQTSPQHKDKAKPTELHLACHAETNVPKIFWGFWKPSPSKDPVKVTIEFHTPATGVDCVGESLELTVPNLQTVDLYMTVDEGACSAAPTATISVSKATGDSPVPDILQLIGKVGAVPFREVAPFYSIPPQKNRIVSIDATCNGSGSRKSTQNVKITFQNPPRVAVSSGVVIAHGVDSYGVKTTQTGVGTGGVTFQNSIAITGSSSAQVIPFGLANIYYAGSRTFNFNAQLGVGVNPNLSTAKVEYFASPFAIGWHDVYISPGVHIGQHEHLTGGFALGELTPSNLSKIPIGWQRYTGFGISISYNLKPLVKSSSSNSSSSK